MFNTTKDLMGKIRLGQDSFLELKEIRLAGSRVSAPSRDSLADELAGFANARGGVCVLGVDDKTREVLGIPHESLDCVEDFVREICNDSIQPPLYPVIERLTLPTSSGTAAPVLRIEVQKSLFAHRSPGGYFNRVGSGRREIPPDYLARLFQHRSQTRITRFDEQPVPAASFDDLKEELWKKFETTYSAADSPRAFLSKLGLARQDEEGVWRPTVAGVLMAMKDPRRYLPNSFVQAVAYKGMSSTPEAGTSGYQLDAWDITGPLDRQVVDACRFVARNMRTAATKTIGRTDIPQYDMTAIFEAVVNAVAHRDYAIYGSKIRLRMYSNRLELYSPGALANTMTVESLPLRQSARNEVLTSLLARCPVPEELSGLKTERSTMMDKRGEGVLIILERTQALSGHFPQYRAIDGEPPEMRNDTAFMDRLHAFAPGWDFPKLIPAEHLTDHFGLVSDFLSECWSKLRSGNRVSIMQGRVHLGGALSGRDIEAVNKTVSGLMKLVFPKPDMPVADEDLEWIVRLALEARRRVKEQQKRCFKSEFRNTHFSYILGAEGVEQFVSTPELHSDEALETDPLPPGQVWAASMGAPETGPGLYRVETNSSPGAGVRILNHPAPPAFRESVRIGEQNLYARAKELVGDRNPREHEFSIQMRAIDADKTGAGVALPVLVSLCGSLLGKNTRGGTIIVGALNLGGSIEPIPNAVRIAELAVDKQAQTLLMPVSARRQLNDLPDDLWTRISIEFYKDAADAVFKALLE